MTKAAAALSDLELGEILDTHRPATHRPWLAEIGAKLVLTRPGSQRVASGDGILGAIGDTPLVQLKRLFPGASREIFAKLEYVNPSGSMKDRSALRMLQDALDARLIDEHSVIVESSSGNMGIALAQACAYFGLRFICVVDPKVTRHNLAILRAYGAEVEMVEEPDPETGELLPARKRRVAELSRRVPGAHWLNQYANPGNVMSHCDGTMREIAEALGGEVDFVLCPTSTCGTIAGCRRYIVEHELKTRLVAVDAVGSALFGARRAPRRLPGLGSSERGSLFDPAWADVVVHVSDAECVAGCRRLLAREAILAGGSSGGGVAALAKLRERIPPEARCVLILPDRGDRYLDTIYADDWVRRELGSVPDLAS
ncbi:2,3-diaminopropionate biosynthesis protein SbnA [Sorangium sp. So ce362]